YPRFGRQTVFWGECLKIQKRQLTRNELVALNFIILGISLLIFKELNYFKTVSNCYSFKNNNRNQISL
ncbi:hypothetical protein LPH68_02840, partial [Bacteroides sp. 1_1_30]|uniref:hypothetical protein n=1 Tax=Bacteroides sp. 1_1_30 TaxID=457387 RepID=UPI001E36600B